MYSLGLFQNKSLQTPPLQSLGASVWRLVQMIWTQSPQSCDRELLLGKPCCHCGHKMAVLLHLLTPPLCSRDSVFDFFPSRETFLVFFRKIFRPWFKLIHFIYIKTMHLVFNNMVLGLVVCPSNGSELTAPVHRKTITACTTERVFGPLSLLTHDWNMTTERLR